MLEIENCDTDDYLIIDEEGEESYDSDKIDSDIEAELYSSIHHEVASSETQDSHMEQKNSLNIVSEAKPNIKIEEPTICNSVSKNSSYTHFVISPETIHSNIKHEVEHNSKTLRRKSDMIANILENIQTKSKKQKTLKSMNSSKSKSLVDVSPNTTLSDSDSSVIFIESDEQGKFETNIDETLNLISSDSDSSSSMSTNIKQFAPSLKRKHLDNTSSTPLAKGEPWYVNTTDLFRKKGTSNRYHESATLNCSNCNKKGHIAKYCIERKSMKCFICGDVHLDSECKNKICSRCFRYGHDKWRCFLREDMYCHLCNMIGHTVKDCPDLWRRYHLTTCGRKIVKGRPVQQRTSIYCYNCGLQGHYGFHCNASRKGDSFPTYTSVISYENPKMPIPNMVMNVPPVFPQLLPTREDLQCFPSQRPLKNKKVRRKLNRALKAMKRLENKIESTDNRQEVNFPRSSNNRRVKDFNAENKKDNIKYKRRAKMRRKQRAIARKAAQLEAMLGQ